MIQRGRPARRAGYTFVELIMVIAIIAVLAALLLGGITKVMGLAARTEVVSDITQMAQALEQAKSKYSHIEFLPSCLVLHNDRRKYRDVNNVTDTLSPLGRTNLSYRALTTRSAAVLQAMFGRRVFQAKSSSPTPELLNWDGSGNINNSTILYGSECLVFYLGGMVDVTGGLPRCVGFSTDAQDPTATGGTDRIGPFFQFKSNRLVKHNAGRAFYEYLDAFPPRQGLPRQPYAYYGAVSPNNYAPADLYRTNLTTNSPTFVNSDNDHLLVATARNAYFEGTTIGNTMKWLYPNKYQIISAGRDQVFGSGGGLNVVEGSIDEFTKDNLANFSSTELGNPVE